MTSNDSTELLQILDDLGYKLQRDDSTKDTLALIFICHALLCFLVNGLCLIHLIISKKWKRNSKYLILTHYFTFKLIFTVVLCISLLMSTVFQDSYFYIATSTLLCRLEFFGSMFMETCENYLLFGLWLILLSEREFIGFKYLDESNENLPESVNEVTTRMWCRKNSRSITLALFYSITSLLTVLFASDVHQMRISGIKSSVCVTSSLASLPFYLLLNYPLIFWFILFSTLLWKLFGAQRDPLLNSLSSQEVNVIKFIKLASLLRALEVILVHTQVTFLQLFWKLDFRVVEASRISGFFVMLATSVMFLYLERVGSMERIRKLFRDRRNTESNSDLIVYANLVE